jgi:hypothetical protein
MGTRTRQLIHSEINRAVADEPSTRFPPILNVELFAELIADVQKAVSSTDDARQTLYREAHLALRAVVGTRELDAFLLDKDVVSQEIEQAVRRRAGELGLDIVSVGIQ